MEEGADEGHDPATGFGRGHHGPGQSAQAGMFIGFAIDGCPNTPKREVKGMALAFHSSQTALRKLCTTEHERIRFELLHTPKTLASGVFCAPFNGEPPGFVNNIGHDPFPHDKKLHIDPLSLAREDFLIDQVTRHTGRNTCNRQCAPTAGKTSTQPSRLQVHWTQA